MGDHFTLLVDKMLTESTIDAVIERQNRFNSRAEASTHESTNTDFSNSHMIVSKSIKLVECRICHDDDQASNMETPCACCGTLKYAHRTCVQRWCNEKGNTICEICLQPFKPGYTSPPQLYLFGRIPMNFRGNWEISRRDLYNWRFSTTFANNHDFIESDFNDQYIAPSSTSILCCRIVAIFFIILLMLRYTLPIIINATDAFSISMFMLFLLSFIGILLLLCIMARAFTTAHRRQQPDHDFNDIMMPDEENYVPQTDSLPHHIRVY